MPASLFDCYVVVAPGLESIAAGELSSLGIVVGDSEPGGVSFGATTAQLYSANLQLRSSSRVLVRAAEFGAKTFFELERHARKIPWSDFVPPRASVRFRVTSRKSKLYHAGAVGERLETAVQAAVAGATIATGGEDVESESSLPAPALPPVTFIVRLFRDRCTVSADSSGELLHRRGYRQDTAKAPLRETLAAAMLLGAGWDGTSPLLDPLSGSGTIPIEAALLARRIPPGWRRGFTFERWPTFDATVWKEVRDAAAARILARAPAPIAGADRDAGALAAAVANAERAGVAEDVRFRRGALSSLEPPSEAPGWLITNPPYGVRMGERLRLRDLYAQLGNVVRKRIPEWRVAFLSADRMLERQTGLPLEERWASTNGGIRVTLVASRA